jgi:hypothetical protein
MELFLHIQSNTAGHESFFPGLSRFINRVSALLLFYVVLKILAVILFVRLDLIIRPQRAPLFSSFIGVYYFDYIQDVVVAVYQQYEFSG